MSEFGTPDQSKLTIDQQNLRDKAAEEAGATNKIRRFTSADDDPRHAAEKDRKLSADLQMTALQTLLQNPAYAVAYQSAWTAIEDVQAKLDVAILEKADLIEEMEANAAKLEDGSPVFQDADGNFLKADGTTAQKDQAPESVPVGAASWEDYQAAKKRAADLAAIQADIIDPTRQRLSDTNDPPQSVEEINEITEQVRRADQMIDGELEAAQTQMPSPENNTVPSTAPGASIAPL